MTDEKKKAERHFNWQALKEAVERMKPELAAASEATHKYGADEIPEAKGLHCVRICGMDDSTAIRPSQLPQRTHVVVVPESDWERVMVKWFN